MFSPDPSKAQEPVFLTTGQSFVLHLKPWTPPPGRLTDSIVRRTVLQVSAVRYRAAGGEVKVALNHDPHPGPPAKCFVANEGEYALTSKVDSISFTAIGRVTLYLEVG